MSSSKRVRLRTLWFQIHKWIGLLLAALIIPISLTGSALVWHDWLDETLNPERKVSAATILPPSGYQAAARRALAPGEKLLSLRFSEDGGPVVATALQPSTGRGRPVRTELYLHPQEGRVLDRASSNQGAVHVMHVLHGSLMVPGVGRQIVGWIGVAMLLSSLTGLWLWWPLNGRVRRGLRWKRKPTTSANLHHKGGFWIALPLAALSFTGAWISFPAFFAALSGDPAGPSPAERMRRMGAQPLVETRIPIDAVVAAAIGADQPAAITLPTEVDPKWKVTARDRPGEVTVNESNAVVTPAKPPQPETTARLMRRIHDGTGMPLIWKIIIFIGGIVPAVLAVTGIMMWWRDRRRRSATPRLIEARASSA